MTSAPTTDVSTQDKPGAQELIARAQSFRQQLWDDAPSVDRNRRLPDSTYEALRDAGLLALTIPERFGGLGSDMRSYLEVTIELGRGCGSTAWVAGVINTGNWVAAQYSEQAQDEVWGTNPLATTSSILAPTSSAVVVDGGVVLNGKWGFTSGVNHSEWVSLCYPSVSPDDAAMQLALAPVGELTVEDTWYVSGMRGTGSNTIIAQDLFIPNHRIRSVGPLFVGDNIRSAQEVNKRVSMAGILPLSLVGPQLGQAKAALDFVIENAPKRRITTTNFASQSASVGVQVDVADAASTIDAALAMCRNAADTLDDWASQRHFPTPVERTRLRNNMAWSMKHAFQAVDQLMSAHGSSAFADFNPLQRIWRDAGIASRHAVFYPRVAQEVYGKTILDQDPFEVTFLV
jgi:3-hydroxy-9,10-secoandrosta-1,3,5(10)-triene-9,17-dione monooxygenase